MYYDGEAPGGRDLKLAAAWHNEAGKIGHAPSLFALAAAYENGEGVAADPQRALGLYKLAAAEGSDVLSVAAGIVTEAGEHFGYGNLVEINHGNGYVTRYGHNEAVLVKPGDRVNKGQRVALMGSTGRSTGPHVHFEVLYNGNVVNPEQYIQATR